MSSLMDQRRPSEGLTVGFESRRGLCRCSPTVEAPALEAGQCRVRIPLAALDGRSIEVYKYRHS